MPATMDVDSDDDDDEIIAERGTKSIYSVADVAYVKKESAFSELMGCGRGSLKKHLALIAVPL